LPGDTSEPTLITCCPLDYITGDIWETLEYVKFCQQGFPPVHGGVLDQTQSFMMVYEQVTDLDKYWKAKLGIF